AVPLPQDRARQIRPGVTAPNRDRGSFPARGLRIRRPRCVGATNPRPGLERRAVGQRRRSQRAPPGARSHPTRDPLPPATPAVPGGPVSGKSALAWVPIPLSCAGKSCSVLVGVPEPTTTRKEPSMPDHVTQELARLPRLSVADLRSRYAELFGETTR